MARASIAHGASARSITAGLVLLLAACSSSGSAATPTSSGGAPTTGTGATIAPPGSTTPMPTTQAPAATTLPVPTAPGATPPATCPTWSEATATGSVATPLDELSGLGAGRRNPEVLWTHNDSGDRARVFAIDRMGTLVTTVDLPDAGALDWEDLDVAPGPDGQPWIWAADTGDNFRIRPGVTVYRFPEPDLGPQPPAQLEAAGVQTIRIQYPDGARDVEAVMVDPVSGDLFLVGKAVEEGTVPVYRVAAAAMTDGAQVTAEPVTRITGRLDDGNGPTAADISADGTLVLVANGRTGFLWLRDPATPIGEVLAAQPTAPCGTPVGGGEAVAFSVDGQQLWSISEGEGARLRRYDRGQ